jgi:hypothetical protein
MELTTLSDQVTDMTAAVPKVINPSAHAVIDYVAAGTFLAAGMALRGRHSRASNCALMNGVAALGLAMMTDYPGGIFRTVSFRTHGVIDVLMTGMCALAPTLMGFAQDAEAQLFHTQAALEAAVVAATDWNSPVVARA